MTTKRETRVISHDGRRYKLTPHRDGWRIRSRARGREVDAFFAATGLADAKTEALKWLHAHHGKPMIGKRATCEELVKVYLSMPKRASDKTAAQSVSRFRAVVRATLKRELSAVLVSEVGPKLWDAYMAKQLGGRLDLSTRRPRNASINSTVNNALPLFLKRLRPAYAAAGISIPEDAASVQWLPEMKLPQPPANEEALIKAWRDLKGGWYFAVGLARFAGLRRSEILACSRSWIVEDGGSVFVELRDRPEENFRSKTGEPYRAMVIDAAFAQALLARGAGKIAETPPGRRSRWNWLNGGVQAWLKPFTGTAKKPLHRLRGLYADEVARITKDAMALHLAAVKEAAKNLGHADSKTTEKHYLSQAAP